MPLTNSMVFLRFPNCKKFTGRANTVAAKGARRTTTQLLTGPNHSDKTPSIRVRVEHSQHSAIL